MLVKTFEIICPNCGEKKVFGLSMNLEGVIKDSKRLYCNSCNKVIKFEIVYSNNNFTVEGAECVDVKTVTLNTIPK